MTLVLRRLSAADAEAWRDLRLEGLSQEPEAFFTTLAEAEQQPLSAHIGRIEIAMAFGAFQDNVLVGMLAVDPMQESASHRAWVNAVYVSRSARGQGVGLALLDIAKSEAQAAGILQLELYAQAGNATAINLYEKAGFSEAGRLPRAVRHEGKFYDDVHLVCRLDD